ncbi:MAG TPA: VOC family protein [Candidatus Dormibacteraeota bacterium]|nr:VOC family protein [Candidatus Dormibacteraeota bacterium]
MSQKIPRRTFLALAGGALVSPKLLLGEVDPPTVLDHILLGCNDLDRGIAFVEEHTGVRAAFGGVHPGRGTRNALLSLGERHYLEIIAPDPQQAGAPDIRNLRQLAEPRLVSWAAHPGDINQFAAHLRSGGIEFEGPTPGSRKRLDGRVLQWKTLNLKNDEQGVLPFFIEWSVGTTHPSTDAPSGCKIERFTISSPNEVELQGFCSLINLDVHVEHAEKPQLYARISGLNGHMMQLKS